MVERRAEIDLLSEIILQIELVWKKSGFQSAESGRGHVDQRLQQEVGFDRWVR